MKKGQVRIFAVLGAVCVALAALASLAWACTPQARMFALTPLAGSPGRPVTVTGDAVPPGAAVQIRWNSSSGAPLAETTADASGKFSAVGPIPEVAPGIYYVVATTGSQGQAAPQIARIAFEVTGSPEASSSLQGIKSPAIAASSELWSGFNATGGSIPNAGLEAASAQTATPGVAMGIGLLAAGSLGLVAGGALIVRRKTRASA